MSINRVPNLCPVIGGKSVKLRSRLGRQEYFLLHSGGIMAYPGIGHQTCPARHQENLFANWLRCPVTWADEATKPARRVTLHMLRPAPAPPIF